MIFILSALIGCDQSVKSNPSSSQDQQIDRGDQQIDRGDQQIDRGDQQIDRAESSLNSTYLECRGARCAHLPSDVEVSYLTASLEGRIEGDRVDFPDGEAAFEGWSTWVFWSKAKVEIHEVYLDDVLVFDITRAFEGVEPQLGVRPTAQPLTLLLPPSKNLSILFRAWRPTQLEISRFTRTQSGHTLSIRVLDFTSHLPDIFTQVESLLPITLSSRWHSLTAAERARVDTWSHAPHKLAVIGDRDLSEVPIIFLSGLPMGVAGQTPSTPLSPYRGEGYILIDVDQAGDHLAHVVAHEIAHALGLLHVSEPSGVQLEALQDTPTCLLDNNADNQLNQIDCPQAAQNLMFWSGSGSTLSADQIQHISLSPLLKSERVSDLSRP